ncbi:MAG TPA: glycoside hydrolase domain-containing protein [Anaerolineales bacterium]|nr:glycoside hydrolase domain-containing protein [Anaerolineales bacterium]
MNLYLSIKRLCSLFFVFSFTLVLSGLNSAPALQVQAEKQVHLDQFDMITESSGWVLIDRQLFWTSDAGQTWTEISPSIQTDAFVEDVQFIDSKQGWLLSITPDSNGGALFQLSQTNDGGISWKTRALSLFESGEIASYAEKAEMGWLDSQTGWISVKQTSGSNFSLGTLFQTSDGGSSWNRFTLPVSDNIYFSDPFTGWATGGPASDQIFKTQDAGITWKSVRPEDIGQDIQTEIYPPVVTSGEHGLLVMTSEGSENALKVYTLQNSSDQWLFSDQVKMDVQPGIIALSMLDAQNFIAVIPGTKSIVRLINGRLAQLENTDGLSASIVELDMVSLDVGWAKSIDSGCVTGSLPDPGTASVSCSSITGLLQTTDGGATWQTMNLPVAQINRPLLGASSITNNFTSSAVTNGENTMAVIGQGFDRCEIPTLSQMQTWSVHSPYESVNLYIGGSNRACNNQALISSYLFQLYQQGWKFFPTWVGPQAPCTGYHSRMSSDVATAYQQGVNEANLAVERLAELGLTGPLKTGSVVYYDIENYGTNTSCRGAVNAFMNGWVSQVHSRGNLAGVYGSTLCNTGLSDFLNITHVPDVIWPARWYHNFGEGFYDPNASVWNLGSCLPNTAWSNHQRIRQYEGDHDETWGSLTLNIDSNVLDGVVAIPYDYPFVSSVVATDSNPTHAASVDFRINFSKSVTGVNETDFVLTTTGGISGVSIASVTGSGTTYTVTVNTGSGNGTIRLNLLDNDSIQDGSNQFLGGSGIGNGNFANGETYVITEPPNVNVHIGAELKGQHFVAQHESTRQSYVNIDNGPAQITGTNGDNLITALRVIWKEQAVGRTSYSEMMGLPAEQLSDEYWFPWYNNLDTPSMDQGLRIANVDDNQHTIRVFVGSIQLGDDIMLAGGDSTRVGYPVNNGPIRIACVDCTNPDDKIIAALRVIWQEPGFRSSYSEMMGLPKEHLSDDYWFPWYNNATPSMDQGFRIANVDTASDNTVEIWLGNTKLDTITLGAGASTRISYPIDNGPIRIFCTTCSNTGNDKIIAALRVIWKEPGFRSSYSEMMGLPKAQLSSEYWFPWYNNATPSMDQGFRIANVDTSGGNTVEVWVGTTKIDTISLGAGGSTRVGYNVDNGPIRIFCTTCSNTGNDKIIVSLRVIWQEPGFRSSYSEMMGLPTGQLSTEYWFPWYNNATPSMDQGFRIALP